MKLLLFLLSNLLLTMTFAGEVALTFDDAPMWDMPTYSGLKRSEVFIKTLRKHKIQTVFFANSGKYNLSRISNYDEAGHLIANHSHTHPDYHKISTKDYIENFNKADIALRQFKNFRPWYRYPYLSHGETIKKRDAMRNHLTKKKYKNGYVTLDIQDWYMASLFNKAVTDKKKINKKKLCKAYSELIWDTMSYYDSKAIELLKRSPRHMLLLHENDLAAVCLETLITKIKSNGWKIISPEIAMEDEIYKIRPNTLFQNNGQIAALYHEAKKIKLYDPWAHPWDGGKLISEEFKKRKVFE